MPDGWTKLTCETCGGNLKPVGMPFEWVLEVDRPISDAEMAHISHRFDEMVRKPEPNHAIILDSGIEITKLGGPAMMQCESCGQCYERNGGDGKGN